MMARDYVFQMILYPYGYSSSAPKPSDVAELVSA